MPHRPFNVPLCLETRNVQFHNNDFKWPRMISRRYSFYRPRKIGCLSQAIGSGVIWYLWLSGTCEEHFRVPPNAIWLCPVRLQWLWPHYYTITHQFWEEVDERVYTQKRWDWSVVQQPHTSTVNGTTCWQALKRDEASVHTRREAETTKNCRLRRRARIPHKIFVFLKHQTLV